LASNQRFIHLVATGLWPVSYSMLILVVEKQPTGRGYSATLLFKSRAGFSS